MAPTHGAFPASLKSRGQDLDTNNVMIQLSPDAQVDTFRTILEMENRGQQLDEIFLRLKNTFVQNSGVVSLPDAVGALDELRWHLQKLDEQVECLDRSLGIQRRKLKRPETKQRIDVNQLRGSTNTIRLPDLVSLLGTQQKTGSLRIKSRHGESFVLELLKGAVVHVVSDTPLPSQMLGNILVAQDKISGERLDAFLRQYSPQNGRIGHALAQAQLVAKADLLDAIEMQARQLFQRIFALEDAVFCFTDGRVSDIEHRVTMNTTHLLFEAARQHDEAERDAAIAAGPPAAAADETQGVDETDIRGALSEILKEAPSPEPAGTKLPKAIPRKGKEEPDDAEADFESLDADEEVVSSQDEDPANLDAFEHPASPTDAELSDDTEAASTGTASGDDDLKSGEDAAPDEETEDIPPETEIGTEVTPSDNEAPEATLMDHDEEAVIVVSDGDLEGDEDEVTAALQDDGVEDVTPEPTPQGAVSEPLETTSILESEPLRAGALARLLGIPRKPAIQLILRDLNTITAIRESSDADLLSIPGIGKKSLGQIRSFLDGED